MTSPQVSVVMPVYNTPSEYLDEAFRSVMLQVGVSFEFIVVNDGSDDETSRKLRELRVKYHDAQDRFPHVALWHKRENEGVGWARNFGNNKAQSEFIVVMDSDDVMCAGRLRAQWRTMRSRPDVDILGGNIIHMGPDGETIEYTDYFQRYKMAAPHQTEQLLLSLAHGTTIMRREAVLDAGGYDDIERPGTDWRLMKRMLENGARASVVPRYFLGRRVWKGSRSFERSEFLQDLYEEWEDADV